MMKWHVLYLFAIFLFLTPQAYAGVDSNITSITQAWVVGDLQPPNIILGFANPSNHSETISLEKTGQDNSYFSIAPTEIIVPAEGSAYTTLIFTIPYNAIQGTHIGYIEGNFDEETIPVIMSVTQNTTSNLNGCRIITRPTALYKSIYTDATPAPESFEVRLTSGCVGGVDVSVSLSGDIVDTTQGKQPARLSSESLGYLEYGTVGSFEVEFDISEVSTRTYILKAILSGIFEDEDIVTEVPITVTVLSPGASFSNTSSSVEPEYIVPTQVQVNQAFQIEVRDLNPNLFPDIIIPDGMVPIGTDSVGGRLLYSLKTNQSGSQTIIIKTRDKNTLLQMFPIREYTINVVGSSQLVQGSHMKFDFYPKISDLSGDATINILTRDNLTNNIIPSTIYVNGLELTDNILEVKSGNSYSVSAVSPNYNTLDCNFTVPLKCLKIITSPSEIEIGDYVNIIVRDNVTNEDVNATIYVDDEPLGLQRVVQATSIGNHSIIADLSGYVSASSSYVCSPQPQLQYAPQNLSLNQTATFAFTKSTPYSVMYRRSANATESSEMILSGTDVQFSFTPLAVGHYSVFMKNAKVKEYVISEKKESLFSSLSFGANTVPYFMVTVVVVICALLLYKYKDKLRRKRRVGYPSSDVVTPMG